MLALETAEALTFDGAKITAFLKTIDRMFATYDIIGNQKKKQWILDYSLPLIAWNLEQVNHYRQLFYLDFCLAACKEYQGQDSYYHFYTVTYLDSIIQDFREIQDQTGTYTQAQLQHFLRLFREVAYNCKQKGNLTKKMITLKFIVAFSKHLQKKAVTATQKPKKKFDQDDIMPFNKVFDNIETHVNNKKDFDKLLEEQEIATSKGYPRSEVH